jgi:DNA-binding IclR family transcriptional regulator
MDSSQGVEAVERALNVLACFEAAGETLSLAQLAQRSRLYKSTILRLAASLQKFDFIRRDANGRFSLGEELRRLAELARVTGELERTVGAELKRLTAATQETASFYVRQGRHRICLFREVAPGSVRHYLLEGGRHTLFVGATGRIFKAYGTASQDTESMQIRRRGWVASRGERKSDLGAVATPLLNARHELLGVMNVSMVLSRFTSVKERQVRLLLVESRRRLQPRVVHLDANQIVRSLRRVSDSSSARLS